MVEDLAIAEVAEKFQVTTRTIRYYEEIGLVHPHRENGHRRFSRKDITRLSLVFRGKKYGFQLEEIKNMIQLIDLDPSGVQQLEKTMEYGRRKMREIDRRLLELEQLKTEMNSWLKKFEEELVKRKGEPL